MLTPLIELRGVEKAFGGLRPLRIRHLHVSPGEVVVVQGPDETAASVLVDLVTAAALPDAGEVVVGGRATATIRDQDSWLAFLDQFGIVNARVVLLDDLTVRQNLAVPLTLDLDPLPGEAKNRTDELAAEVSLAPQLLDQRLALASPLARLQVRLGRAIALHPRIVLVEHPTLGLPAPDVAAAAAVLGRVAGGNRSMLVLSGDDRLAGQLPARRLDWKAATGELKERRRGWWRSG